MAIPNIFASNFAYATVQNVTDVQTWIDGIRTLLTTTLAVADRWTESPTNTLVSPADPVSGYKMTLVLSRITALRMGFVTKDQNGNTIVSNFEVIATSGETAKISGGPKHIITWGTSGTNFGASTLVDPSPEAANAPTIVVFTKCSHAGGGGVSFGNLPERWNEFGATSGGACGPYFVVSSGSMQCMTAAGSMVYIPVAMAVWTVSSNPLFVGYAYQMVWADVGIAAPARVEVPIDDGVVGIFERCGFLATMGSGFTTQCVSLLARVG